MRDGYSKTATFDNLVNANVKTTPDPDGTDLTNAGSVLLVANVGDSLDTLSGSVKIEFTVEESADGSAWTTVTDNDEVVGGTLAASTGIFYTIDAPAKDQVIVEISYTGDSKHARILPTFTGTHTNGIPLGLLSVLMDLREAPPVA